MEDSVEKYGLDLHCTMILEDYRANWSVYAKLKEVVLDAIRNVLKENGLMVTAIEGRIKTEASLAGKLELKGQKYLTIDDITDIVGTRVITYYSEDVDKISAFIEKLFNVDWANSVDKRKMHQLDSFGYMSLHYVCRVPESLFFDAAYPGLNDFRFEIQLRTTLQHVWAQIYHDIGYKSGVEVPVEYLRNMNRLAGMLEMADDEFSRIRTSITDYRRQVTELVSSGKFDDVPLNGDSFNNYLNLKPFDKLNHRIAAINQAEIHVTSLKPYLALFKNIGFTTLGDIDRMIKNESEDAFQLAVFQLGGTDLDIISSFVAVQNLCVVYILKKGAGQKGLEWMFNTLNGKSEQNKDRAARLYEKACRLPFMANANAVSSQLADFIFGEGGEDKQE